MARLRVRGLSERESAHKLRVEPKAVSNRDYGLEQKIGADNRLQIVPQR